MNNADSHSPAGIAGKKRFIATLVITALFLSLFPITVKAADTPSSWAVVEINQAKTLGLVIPAANSNYQGTITRELFCELVINLVETLNGTTVRLETADPFSDTSNTSILKAYQLGIVTGMTTTRFAPSSPITREQIAAMMMRAARALDRMGNLTYASVPQYQINQQPFADQSKISLYALPDIRLANYLEILRGVGGNKINPLGNTTVEQSILMIKRLYDGFALFKASGSRIPTPVTIVEPVVPSKMVGSFDTSGVANGVISVIYKSTSTARMKIMITKGTVKYTYDVNANGVKESYPLQMGNGTYKVSLLQNTSGTSYKVIQAMDVEVNLKDSNTVFLTSIQNINWNVDSAAVEFAVSLTKNTSDLQKKAEILWDYMAKNNSYDYNKAATVVSGYVPVIDTTLRDKTGICYDFSSLYAAMLRSQGIPSKLIKGYAPKYAQGYHAWNEVYDQTTKKWLVIDATYDLQVIKTKPQLVTMIKNASEYSMTSEY